MTSYPEDSNAWALALNLRFQARGYLTFVDTDTAFFCASGSPGAVCRLRGSGSTFIQYDLLAGAALAF